MLFLNQKSNIIMTRIQMIKAIHSIIKGQSIKETDIPVTEKNLIQWQELQQEMHSGYAIDLPQKFRA